MWISSPQVPSTTPSSCPPPPPTRRPCSTWRPTPAALWASSSATTASTPSSSTTTCPSRLSLTVRYVSLQLQYKFSAFDGLLYVTLADFWRIFTRATIKLKLNYNFKQNFNKLEWKKCSLSCIRLVLVCPLVSHLHRKRPTYFCCDSKDIFIEQTFVES